MIAQPLAVAGGQRTTPMSRDVLSVGKLSAPQGQKQYGMNEFLVQGQPYRLPMWLINGVGEGPTLVVTAGIHAAEYASIAAALELGRSLDPASLSGRVIVVPIVDIPAFSARSIYICPLDGKNPNRVFLGVIKDYEGRVLQTAVSPADGIVLFIISSLA